MNYLKTMSMLAIAGACFCVSIRHVDADDPHSTLVISAAFDNGTFRANEFIVLRETGHDLEWTATVHDREENRTGKMRTSGNYLASTFARIAKQPEDRTPLKQAAPGVVYSLLLIDERGSVHPIASLNVRQMQKAKTELRSVFDVILKQGSYAKSNIMLDLLLSPDALRATAKPQ